MLTLVKDTPVVKIENLTKKFGEVTALDDISVEIPQGSIIGLLGPNGSGKTTLLKIIAGLYLEYEGKVTIDGERPSHLSKAKVAYLPDKSSFGLNKSPQEVIELHKRYFDDFSVDKCYDLLKKFEIAPDMAFQEMSKGMIEKVQISLTMARDARLYLLDEPIGGVDCNAREIVLDTILESFDYKGTIIVVTHLINEIERLFDTVMIVKEGKLLELAACDEIQAKYGGGSLEHVVKGVI